MSPRLRAVSIGMICLMIVVPVVWDVVDIVQDPSGETTISWLILTQSHSYPIIPFVFGVLCGHWFASQNYGKVSANVPK